MVKITEKQELIIKIFILVVSLSLSLIIYLHGKGLECNQCIIEFKDTQKSGVIADYPSFKVKLIDLYDNLVKSESCLVKWDKTQGYIGGINYELD